jgi:hypothetical protein
MNFNYIIKLIILVMLSLIVMIFYLVTYAKAGGPWSDQYCNIEIETVITKNNEGKIIDKKTIEKVKCEDVVNDFLHGAEIAESCQFFTWQMPLGQKMVTQRSIACKKLNGGYEIVQGYHGTD